LLFISFTYILARMPAQPLSQEQLNDAARLKQHFATWQKAQRDAGLPSSQEAISEKLGFNQSSLSQYLNGRIPLNIDAATKFANLIGKPVAEFSATLAEQIGRYAGPADPVDSSAMLRRASQVSLDELDPSGLISVPMVTMRVEAGVPGFEADLEFEDGGVIQIPREAVESENWAPQCLLAVKVRGLSMIPVFADGDTIVLNVADRKLVSGEVYAVNCEGKPAVKQMVFERQQWYMRSFNPTFEPKPFRTPDSDVIGKVVYQPGRVVSGRMK
jgi:phage repressor protein C with HTH and peptisase S24 domain